MNEILKFLNGVASNFTTAFNLDNIEYGKGSIYHFLTFKNGINKATMVIPMTIDARVALDIFNTYSGTRGICIGKVDMSTQFFKVAGLDTENITISVDNICYKSLKLGQRDKDIRARLKNLFSDSSIFKS